MPAQRAVGVFVDRERLRCAAAGMCAEPLVQAARGPVDCSQRPGVGVGAERGRGTCKAAENLREACRVVPERRVAAGKDCEFGAAGLVNGSNAPHRIQELKEWLQRIDGVSVGKHNEDRPGALRQAGAKAVFECQDTQGGLIAPHGMVCLVGVDKTLFVPRLLLGRPAEDRLGSAAQDLADADALPGLRGRQQTGGLAENQAQHAGGMVDGERQSDRCAEFRPQQDGVAQSQMGHESCEQADAALNGERPGVVAGATVPGPVDQEKAAAGWGLLPQEVEVARAVTGGVKAQDGQPLAGLLPCDGNPVQFQMRARCRHAKRLGVGGFRRSGACFEFAPIPHRHGMRER